MKTLPKKAVERLEKQIEVLMALAAIEGVSARSIFNGCATYEFNNCTVCFKSKTLTVHLESSAEYFNTAEGNTKYYALMGIASNFNLKFLG